MKKRLIMAGFIAVFATAAMAQPVNKTIDKNTAKQMGGDLGKALNPGVTQGIKTGNPAALVPGYNTDPEQKQYFQAGQGSTVGPGATRVAGCVNQGDVECQAVNLMRLGPETRPQFTITQSDPLLGKVRNITGNPTAIVGDIFSSYETCKTTSTTIPPIFETQVCNEFSFNEDKICKTGWEVVVNPDYLYSCVETIQSQSNATCTIGRVVKVDVDYQYQCQQSPKKVTNLSCEKSLIVTCTTQSDGCDTGGIVPGTTQGDMRVSFGPLSGGTYGLEFGTFADNYWSGNAAIFDRTLQFSIANKSQVTQFTLVNAAFDDWIALRVNGHLVYVGPYGGDRLEVVMGQQCFETEGGQSCYPTKKIQYGANQFGNPELNTSWNINLGIDLRPYLVDGANVIAMRTIVTDKGEGAIRINARMACPGSCTDRWDDQCAALDSKTR